MITTELHFRERTFKLYAHKIPLAKSDSFQLQMKAFNIVENVAEYLATVYKGFTDSNGDSFQSIDTLIINVSSAEARRIENEFPFITEHSRSKYRDFRD